MSDCPWARCGGGGRCTYLRPPRSILYFWMANRARTHVAVLEDLDNVKAIQPVIEKIAELQRQLADSQLVWRGEAWTPSLLAYGVAKVLSRTNAALRSVVDPIAAIFATHRTRAAKVEEPKESKEK